MELPNSNKALNWWNDLSYQEKKCKLLNRLKAVGGGITRRLGSLTTQEIEILHNDSENK